MTLKAGLLALALIVNTTSTFADSLRCDSENVSIRGEVQTKYVRMGRSDFQGRLGVTLYDQGQITSFSQIQVAYGTLQDDRGIFVHRAVDGQGRVVSLDISFDALSTLAFDGEVISFAPHCEIRPSRPSSSAPASCHSDLTLGQLCGIVDGQCVCHQHNGH